MAVNVLDLPKPYLIFLGDAGSAPYAKTAYGVKDWAPEACLAQHGLPGCTVDLKLPVLTPQTAAKQGARSLLIGVAAPGGEIPSAWRAVLLDAAKAGLHVISGTHTQLVDVPELASTAARAGVKLIDVRHSNQRFPIGTGRRRAGRRLLTVGTDCALGKKYTALALAKALRARGVAADFRATGQTGIMIAGSGIAIDAVVADFIAGAAETLSPDAAPDHWDVIEGQGSLFHPSYAAVTLGLLHGSQPDVLILCHDPTRPAIRSLPDFLLPSLPEAAARYIEAARLTNPGVRLAGVSLNTSRLNESERQRILASTAAQMDVPCFDPMLSALNEAIDRVLAS